MRPLQLTGRMTDGGNCTGRIALDCSLNGASSRGDGPELIEREADSWVSVLVRSVESNDLELRLASRALELSPSRLVVLTNLRVDAPERSGRSGSAP